MFWNIKSSSSWGCELKWPSVSVGDWWGTRSSSSWGCELKYKSVLHGLRQNSVILFVRMWVEIKIEDSCGLEPHSHPLREDVSWNISNAFFVAVLTTSSSSWGCELKYTCARIHIHPSWSSSSWGCELKWWYRRRKRGKCRVILFVRMWVEM